MNYVEEMRAELVTNEPDLEPELLDLYLLLALVKGVTVTRQDVHDAWAVWRSRTLPEHPALVPFSHLPIDIQLLDEPYRLSIWGAALARRLAQRTNEGKA